jgi:hypothetical protein
VKRLDFVAAEVLVCRPSRDGDHRCAGDSIVFIYHEIRETAPFFEGKDFKKPKYTRFALLIAAFLLGFSSLVEAIIS